MPAIETNQMEPGQVYRWRSQERYVSDDGQHLTIDWHFRFTVNGAGEVVADFQLLDCQIR